MDSRFSQNSINIYKIHGSISDLDSIRTTISYVSSKVMVEARTHILRQFFEENDNDILILGYSGSDHFDINQVIKEIKITSVPKKFVIPVKTTIFKDFKISIPNNFNKYLETIYNKDWKTPVIFDKTEIKKIANSLFSKLNIMKK